MKNIIKNFWNNRKLSEADKNEMMVDTCRKVFSTEEGKVVLNMLITDLRLFQYSYTDTDREKYLNEYAKFFIRERLGVSDTKTLTDFIAETSSFAGGK